MQKSKVLAVLLCTAILTNSPAFAGNKDDRDKDKPEPPKSVTVVNTPNVNVTNTPNVSVTSLPPVTGSVAVSNTPTVNVGNTASVNVANTPNVTISNNTAQPVVSSSIDNPGRIAYQAQASNSSGSCSGAGTCFFEFGQVPAGHRVVVQHVSGLVSFFTTPNSVWVQVNNGSGAPVSTFFAPMAPSTSFSAFDQTVQAYFDPAEHGGVIEVQVALMGGTFSGAVSPNLINLSGYELDCSAAPCAPIAH
jgi:hypothetical protein